MFCSSASLTGAICSWGGSEEGRSPLASYLGQEIRPQRGGQEGNLGHRLCDAIVQRHGHCVPEGNHAALEELVVIGGEGIGG